VCGIAGLIDWQAGLSDQGTIIEAIIGRLSHRGPDAHSIWVSPCAALAHHRLAVVDPEAGKQPMIYETGEQTFVIVYNGELYNFRELRSELSIRGHSFQSNSDTEVLLHTYLEWGEECTRHLNGIFAFGIWDENKQQLFMARDHLGVKPLFYAERGKTLIFASEIKALMAHPAVKPEVDAEGLAQIFSGVPIHTPGFVPYTNVEEVRPGEQMVFTREHKRVARYWSLRSAPHTDDLGTTTEHIRALLNDIVKRQLITDLPLVAMLSGGLDSSGLVALATREFKREHRRQLHTYSLDFVESGKYFTSSPMQVSLDEPWVKRVSEYVGTRHHTVTVDTADLIENLLAPTYAHDMPSFFGQMETALYLHCKAMRRDNATVAVSGEAADEIFGGYDWFFDEEVRTADMFSWQNFFGNQVTPWWSPEVNEKIRPREYLARRYQEAREEVPTLAGENAFDAKMREISYMNQTRFLPILLDRVDRMSMAVGLEVRLPFCDYRLMEYVWNIPWEMKTIGDMEKGILRRAFADVLPSDVRRRKKSPYPTSQHPKYQEGISKWVLQILNDANAPIRPFLDLPVTQALAVGYLPDLPGSLRVSPMEQIIKINAWLQEYRICIRW
jgi:asparagine synthase (glutamine-hydrolysing)